ncbi:MAG TPA: hypothetical protein VG148_00220 [Pyrinomonadaceae bacterium]|nr:hypothetical protein [Pyrinomonadaceae bacterium]
MQDFNQQPPGGFGAPPKKKGLSKGWVVAIVVVVVVAAGFVVLLAAGVAGYLWYSRSAREADSPQRLQWIAYRDYKGQKQMLNIMLASRGKDFARHEDALYGILYSMKFGQ